MEYDVEGDWQLLNTCNYRCSYCFFSDETLGEKLKPVASNCAWSDAFDATGLTWLLHMTGGEPSVYPDFADLCERLSKRHLLSINSNMTHKSWEDFAKHVSPDRVSFINAGLHLAEREKKSGIEAYLKNTSRLSKDGFQMMCSLVMTPQTIERFDEAIQLLAPIGMYPIPKVMRGVYEGCGYPNSYNRAERQAFRKYTNEARKFYAPLLNRAERPTIDMFSDSDMVHGTPDYSGLMCEAGRLFFRIDTKGDVFRCGDSRRYGNLLEHSFFREKKSSACDSFHCFYFCDKYSEKAPVTRKLYRLAKNSLREITR